MTVGRAFRTFTRVIRRLERSNWEVIAVSPADDAGLIVGDRLVLQIECRRPDGSGGSAPLQPSNGTLGEYRTPPEIISEVREISDDIDITPEHFSVDPDGTMSLGLSVQIAIPPSASPSDAPANATAAGNGSTPLHRDRQSLQTLYREHETFAEMAAATDREISEETIRRYMIEHGIHRPDTSRSPNAVTPTHASGDADDPPSIQSDPNAVATDGIGFPGGMDQEAFVEAVCEAKTVRDVVTRLGTDRETTVSILRELDLLDTVMGRVRTASDRTITKDDVRTRLQGAD